MGRCSFPFPYSGQSRWSPVGRENSIYLLMSLTTTLEDDDVDYEDETPFLKNDDDASLHKQTPLPIKQISFLLLPWIAESIVDHSISPYLNQVRTTAAAAWVAGVAL